MRRYIILFFGVLSILYSCNGNTPDDIIEEKKMIRLLADVHIADGSLYNISSTPDTVYKYGTGRFVKLFKAYNTDSTQFNRSLKYYVEEPEQFQVMYDEILKILQRKSDSLNKVLAKQNEQNVKKNSGRVLPKKPVTQPDSVKKDTVKKGKVDSAKVKKMKNKYIKRISVLTDKNLKIKNAIP